MLYCRRFPLKLKWAVYDSYVRPAILYDNEAWYVKEIGFLCRTERCTVRAMCGAQKRSTNKMFMLCMSETIDQLAMATIVSLYGHVLIRRDGHVLIKALHFEVEGQMKKGRPKRM